MRWLVNTRQNWGFGQLDLLIGIRQFDGSLSIVQPLTFKRYELNMAVNTPTIGADSQYDARDFLQAAVDHAATLGIIPSKQSPISNELVAVRYHLEDMRKLAFK